MNYHFSITKLTRHSVKSSILVSASGHQSNTSSMKGIPEPEVAVVRPASATQVSKDGPGSIEFTKSRITMKESCTCTLSKTRNYKTF